MSEAGGKMKPAPAPAAKGNGVLPPLAAAVLGLVLAVWGVSQMISWSSRPPVVCTEATEVEDTSADSEQPPDASGKTATPSPSLDEEIVRVETVTRTCTPTNPLLSYPIVLAAAGLGLMIPLFLRLMPPGSEAGLGPASVKAGPAVTEMVDAVGAAAQTGGDLNPLAMDLAAQVDALQHTVDELQAAHLAKPPRRSVLRRGASKP